MPTFKFFCSFHLGDQLFLLWFLNAAAKRWPDIHFSFRVPTPYLDEVQRLARKVPNLEITDKDDGHRLEGWMGQEEWYWKPGRAEKFVDFRMQFHAYLASKYGLPAWTVDDRLEMLLPGECMDADHPLKHESFDLLLVNSEALSGQCSDFSQGSLDDIARSLKRQLKVVTTHPCDPEVPSTLGLGMRLSHLGELASRCRVIAGVANAPFLATFNELAFPKVERWLNYANDYVNFDDRVRWCRSLPELRAELASFDKAYA